MRWPLIGLSLLAVLAIGFVVAKVSQSQDQDRADEALADVTADSGQVDPVDPATVVVGSIDALCGSQLEPLMTALHDADSRLSVGMDYSAYTDAVAEVRVAYDRVPTSSLSPECISGAGVKAEDALNEYVKAQNEWSRCIGHILSCKLDKVVKPRMQRRWAKAERLIGQADGYLEG